MSDSPQHEAKQIAQRCAEAVTTDICICGECQYRRNEIVKQRATIILQETGLVGILKQNAELTAELDKLKSERDQASEIPKETPAEASGAPARLEG